MSAYGIPELFIILIFILPALILPIFALVQVSQDRSQTEVSKAVWVLVILLAPIIGPIVYLLIGRNNRLE